MSATAIGTLQFNRTNNWTGTWTAGKNTISSLFSAGTCSVQTTGEFTITIGGQTFTGGVQDGYGMLVAARTSGDPGIVVLTDRVSGVSAQNYANRVFHGILFEDSTTYTSAGITTETFSASAGTLANIGQGTENDNGTTAVLGQGSFDEAVSSFGTDGTFTATSPPTGAPDERLRCAINGSGTRGVWIDAEDVAGSDPEIGVLIGD